MIIGEAANMLTEEFRNTHPITPWRQITGMRNLRKNNNTSGGREVAGSSPVIPTGNKPIIPIQFGRGIIG